MAGAEAPELAVHLAAGAPSAYWRLRSQLQYFGAALRLADYVYLDGVAVGVVCGEREAGVAAAVDGDVQVLCDRIVVCRLDVYRHLSSKGMMCAAVVSHGAVFLQQTTVPARLPCALESHARPPGAGYEHKTLCLGVMDVREEGVEILTSSKKVLI